MSEPWIRVHANLISRPVVGRAMEVLRLSRYEAIGCLVCFWGSVSQHVPGGFVASFSDTQLEAWAGWTKKRGKFAAFIRAHHLDAEGRVNEWDEYAGALETVRAKDRARQQKYRDSRRDVTGDVRVTSADAPRDVPVTSRDTIRYDTKRYETSSTRAYDNTAREALETPDVNEVDVAIRLQLSTALGGRSDDVRDFLRRLPAESWPGWMRAMLKIIGPGSSFTADDLANACEDSLALPTPLPGPHALRAFVAKAKQERIANAAGRTGGGTGRGAAAESEQEAAERRRRQGLIMARRARHTDGDLWWARMEREAAAAGVGPWTYAYDHMGEGADARTA